MAASVARVVSGVEGTAVPNGRAMASFLGAGVGAFAMGAFVVLNEAGILAAPTLYGPAGGVSGRTTLAVIVWLIAWAVLDYQLKDREVAARRVYAVTLGLIAIGILATFPPIWGFI